jgi:hypothetical protein
MRSSQLLSGSPPLERGSAPVESLLAIVILLFLALGVVEVAFALYGRNVVAASAHEGARAGIEVGRSPADAAAVASRAVRSAAGALISHLKVDSAATRIGGRLVVRVRVSGTMESFGPVPFPIPVSAAAAATRDVVP